LSEEKKTEIRELLKWLGETPQLDAMEKWGADREKVKEYKSAILTQVKDESKKKVPFDFIYRELVNLNIPHRIGETYREDIGPNPKKDYIKLIVSTMKMLAGDYIPQPKIHPKYSGMPTADNITYWKDQYGYNIFDTPRRKIADMAILQYETRYNKKLYPVEVKPSDPVEDAPEPHKEKKGKK